MRVAILCDPPQTLVVETDATVERIDRVARFGLPFADLAPRFHFDRTSAPIARDDADLQAAFAKFDLQLGG